MAKPTDLVHGTRDLLILPTLVLRPMHGWRTAQRIRHVSKDVLQVNLYPALDRLERQGWIHAKWGESEKQSPREVLFANARRREVSAPGASAMEAPVIGHWAGPGDVLRR